MKTISKKLIAAILAAALVCSVFASCGRGDGGADIPGAGQQQGGGQQQQGGEDPSEAQADDYEYPELSGRGRDFVVLAPLNEWFYYSDIVFEQSPPDVLDAAVHNRNRFIENQFEINITTLDVEITQTHRESRRIINSGMDVYDMGFIPTMVSQQFIGALVTEGLFYDLNDLYYLNLEEPWWNQVMRKQAEINGRLYYASNDINISTLQGIMCIYFNKFMMDNLQIPLPYDLVREGAWTFDALHEYMRAGANLNGAEHFSIAADTTAVYGLVSHDFSANALIMGAGERFIAMDDEGYPYFALGTERFFSVIDKINDMFRGEPGLYRHGNYPGNHEDSNQIFLRGNAMMVLADLNAATHIFRDMDDDFGIVPIPKFEERQENYFNMHAHYSAVTTVVPHNVAEPDLVSAVLDAWAYKSYKDVTPVFFDLSVSYKGLRDEDSIEMLQIIRAYGSVDMGVAYGWSIELFLNIATTLSMGGNFQAVVMIDRQRDRIQSNIDNTMARIY
jgi:ABC-type glycerol-3-phosphate transport system substrate-binding protein